MRRYIGYGPETLASVLPRFYTMPGADGPLENRFHNLTWDLWASIGASGTIVFFGLFCLLAFDVYRFLGLIASRKQALGFWGVVLAVAATVVAFLSVWQGLGYAGLGLQAGIVAGLITFPLLSSWIRPVSPSERPAAATATLLLVLLAALAGHMIAIGFSFPVTPTAALFWAYGGLILALTRKGADLTGCSRRPAAERTGKAAARTRTMEYQ